MHRLRCRNRFPARPPRSRDRGLVRCRDAAFATRAYSESTTSSESRAYRAFISIESRAYRAFISVGGRCCNRQRNGTACQVEVQMFLRSLQLSGGPRSKTHTLRSLQLSGGSRVLLELEPDLSHMHGTRTGAGRPSYDASTSSQSIGPSLHDSRTR